MGSARSFSLFGVIITSAEFDIEQPQLWHDNYKLINKIKDAHTNRTNDLPGYRSKRHNWLLMDLHKPIDLDLILRPWKCKEEEGIISRYNSAPFGDPSCHPGCTEFWPPGSWPFHSITLIKTTACNAVAESHAGINTFAHTPSKEWFQTSSVLRVSLGNFLFFGTFALIMIGVKDQNDRRDSWQHGGWILKIVVWALLIVLMFFVPNVIITIYETMSKFGSGLFLLAQVIMLLDFTHRWNDAWVEKDEQKWYIALLVISVGCYLAAFTFSGLLFMWFNPSGYECGLNVFFIVMTIILAFAFAIIALHPQVNGSLLPASVISVYCAYVCYTGLSSEPRDYECNGLHKDSKAVSTGRLILGMFTTVLSVVYSAVRAGSSTTFLSPPSSPRSGAKQPLLESDTLEEGQEEKEKHTEARPVSYSYAFFHLIFALASMYSGMLLTGWTSSTESTELIDVGWTSVWIRICTEWVTAALYVWTLVAPLIFPDREF